MDATRKAPDEIDEWLSLNAAATALGESRLTVLHRIVKGELVGKPIGGRTVVRRDGVDALLAARTEALAS